MPVCFDPSIDFVVEENKTQRRFDKIKEKKEKILKTYADNNQFFRDLVALNEEGIGQLAIIIAAHPCVRIMFNGLSFDLGLVLDFVHFNDNMESQEAQLITLLGALQTMGFAAIQQRHIAASNFNCVRIYLSSIGIYNPREA
ncbi:hypothetical protein ACA910_018771 [Epithemia clementina (nom. ined.)]